MIVKGHEVLCTVCRLGALIFTFDLSTAAKWYDLSIYAGNTVVYSS